MDEKPTPERREGLFTERNVQLGLAIVLFGLAGAVAVVWVQAIRGYGSRQAKRSQVPEADPICHAWRAAEKGDVDEYLACFTGAARKRLDGDLAALGRARFQDRLRAASDAATGIQFGQPKRAEEDAALIFPVLVGSGEERELSDYIVVKVGKEWKIRAVVPRGRVRTVAPEDEPAAEQGGKT